MFKTENKKDAAFTALYEMYRVKILAFFLSKRVDIYIAQEFVQDVFLKYRSNEYDLDEQQAQAILLTIAKNIFIDHVRKLSSKSRAGLADHQLRSIDDEFNITSSSSDVARIAEGREKLKLVLSELNRLPDKQRRAFIAFRFDGRSQRQIAEDLGVSVSMVEKYIAGALKNLRKFND